LNARFIFVDIELVLNPENSHYFTFHHDSKEKNKLALMRQYNMFGLTVGDIIKQYWYNESKLINIPTEFHSYIKQAIAIDTSNGKHVMGVNTNINGTVHVWNNIYNTKNYNKYNNSSSCIRSIRNNGNQNNFQTHCQSILLFHVSETRDMNEKFLNSQFNTNLIIKLLKYMVFGIDPDSHENKYQYLLFDPPKSIPDILQQIYKQ
jgi:hypothetical protein